MSETKDKASSGPVEGLVRRPMHLTVWYRTLDTQGPDYEDHRHDDILYVDGPILLSEIREIVEKRWGGWLISDIEVMVV